jgi:hypothetical protein
LDEGWKLAGGKGTGRIYRIFKIKKKKQDEGKLKASLILLNPVNPI